MSNNVFDESVIYHRRKPYGKLSVVPTKPLDDREDLALAYSPGVAEPCRLIQNNPLESLELTSRGNLVAVISNGTAVLGLGNIGALASKPVMEGKAALFKKFGNIDSFDIEIDETDPDKLVEIIASLEPTFGGINLEDIKAPECFYVEQKLKERMKIPVFHDDQHGTAVIVAAATQNALELLGKNIQDVKLVASGAGAGAMACLNLLMHIGIKRENITVCDSKGAIHSGREDIKDPYKKAFMIETPNRTLKDALRGADMFLGLSVANVFDEEMIASLAPNPLILALANPNPEVTPEQILKVRSDAIIATGRSDYPNQVNNVLCFPYLFRGALDVGASCINEEMKIAAVDAIARLAKAETTDVVANAYGGEVHRFGRDYIIPKPFDRRLYMEIAAAVARAAMDTGVATKPIQDFATYLHDLESYVYRSTSFMRPIFEIAKSEKAKGTRICFAEGEDNRVLQAAQGLADRGIGHSVLIGRPEVIKWRIDHLGLRIVEDKDFTIVDPNSDSRFQKYWQTYHSLMERKGVSPDDAKIHVRSKNSLIAALAVRLGDADVSIAGLTGRYIEHFRTFRQILGLDKDADICAAVTPLILPSGPLFLCDPYVNEDPTADELVEITELAMKQVRQFGLTPKVALVSHSNFGTSSLPSAKKLREVRDILAYQYPDLEIDGEMHAHLALDEDARSKFFPNSNLKGMANLLIFPNIESANISYNLIKTLTECPTLDPILMGLNGVAHVLSQTASVRTILNMSTLAVAEFQGRKALSSSE
ncbi:MAG: NADP-dependent malic enzyme [Candidatus Puniceispirillum sp.]|nr:NADP-dependent malic enzyme [Candidatus Pelagibacter sp.]MBA4283078.1 NADP-dependent malic enzyme [Candidatus Puniceispirillum sp.]